MGKNKIILLLAAFSFFPVPHATASEFSNLFAPPEAAQQSRRISANVLEALQAFLEGLRRRELREGSGEEQFRRAAEILYQASKEMREIQQIIPGGESARRLSPEQVQVIQSMAYGDRLSGENVGDLYATFAAETEAFASDLQSAGAGDDPIYPLLAPRLGQLFMLAGLVTEAGFGRNSP